VEAAQISKRTKLVFSRVFDYHLRKYCNMGRFDDLVAAHARLKARIHAYRYPIHSRAGRFAMGCVYFFTPLIVGYWTMRATNVIANHNLGEEGQREKLVAASRKWNTDRESKSQ